MMSKAAEDNAEPVMKKSRLENDFEQLFGPNFESGRNNGESTAVVGPHPGRLSLLARLAYRYLEVPATSTPSERVFSLAGNTITRQRASLHPANVDTLIFLHENL